MYIEPNSNIVLLKGIRLDNSYDHTIYFANKQAQYNYFYSKKKVEFTQNYYQRVERGYFKADINAEQLYDVSYMMFRNTAFGDRWFYAFVTSAEYINNRVTRIGFEIDVMQTWMFDYELLECWVEREHIVRDVIGNNIVPENLNLGDYMVESRSDGVTWENDPLELTPCVCIATTTDCVRTSDGTFTFDYVETVEGRMYGKIYSGVKYKVFTLATIGSGSNAQYYFFNYDTVDGNVPYNPDNPSGYQNAMEINDWLTVMTEKNKSDAIISMFMFYSELFDTVNPDKPTPIDLKITNNYNQSLGGYTPRNKKLYTFPYNLLSVTDNRGNMASYKFEYWDVPSSMSPVINDNEGIFALYSGLSCDPSLMLVPLWYNRPLDGNYTQANYDEKLIAKGFPPCSWNIDAFKAYIAQNGGWLGVGASLAMQTIETYTQIGANELGYSASHVGNVVAGERGTRAISRENMLQQKSNRYGASGGDIKAASALFNSIKEIGIASTRPPQFGGNANGDVIFSTNLQKFTFEIKHVRPEFARIIDDYFDMYGYATKQLKVPNTHSRPHWNYVQTEKCVIETDLNIDDTRAITSIYDRGITFWKDGDEIGDYSLDNRAW